VSREGGVATLTLDPPDKRNALDRRSVAELRAAIAECDLAADVRVVALRGAGKDFCAGLDLDEPIASEVFLALRALPKVTVAVVSGKALAGGCALASACDLVVARAGSRFGYPEIERGFVSALGMTMLRRTVGEKTAFDLVATGRVLDAEEALRVGLVSRVLPAKTFEADITKLLASLAALPVSALALTKRQFYRAALSP
jgi:methylglutaconyl-CoA hydratase